jgi:outer membrane PBP1 activator LpoA protein
MIARYRPLRNAPIGARWCRAAILCALALGLNAFSAAQSPAASDGETATANPPAGAEARVEPPAIALVLPLGSATFGRAAEALQSGFLAAAGAAGAKPLVIGHGDGDVLDAFAKAKDAGARVIVGPLIRDDVKAVAGAALELPPTLALNLLDEDMTLPDKMYTLTLTIDGEARQLARRAREGGAMTVAVIASDSPLQKRFASAFNAEWILAGGDAPVMFRFDRSPEMLALLRRELARTRFDAALLAVDGGEAALAKSYVKSIPTYTSSQVNERQPREARRDLDDVVFVDIPWLVDPDAAGVAGLKRPVFPNTALDRLYALGIDAFRVAQTLADGPPEKLEMDGATGRLSLDANRQFVREGRLLQFRAGEIVPAGGR